MIISQYISLMKTETEIQMLLSFTERMMTEVPIYMLENRGDRESARLAHDYITGLRKSSHWDIGGGT